jgi:hypothetical protein
MKDLFGNKVKRTRKKLVIPEGAEPYYPSNRTCGDIFEAENCFKCKKSPAHCSILFGAYNGKRPKQWVRLIDGRNVCLSKKEK